VESDRDAGPFAVTSVEIRAGRASYRAHIGSGLLDHAGETIAQILAPSPCAIISDTKVAPLFAERLERSLVAAGFKPIQVTIPAGENSKRLEEVGSICIRMIAAGLDRTSLVVGLGGGVIGDISGFVAAIYQRGIAHVQVPTTLLAMVDSSIGGKTGVNSASGKNLIGAVHHPVLVIDDVALLETLPARELNQGFAEIVKHAIIADAEMFRDLQRTDRGNLAPLIQRNVAIKAKIVGQDELDRTGERALLNFGHTIGHAIERAGDYKQFLHGEAISLGMVAAAAISMKRAGLSQTEKNAVVDLLKAFDLPTKLPADFPRTKILDALPFDKKFEQGAVRFVVTPAIGSARLSSEVTMDDLREAVSEL
jgi:3-dehydroquinate synthase